MYLNISEDKGTSAAPATATGLPLSRDSSCASSSVCWSIKSPIFQIIFPFSFAGTLVHFPESNASLAAFTAKSISLLLPAAHEASFSPVAGSSTSNVLEEFVSTHFPPMYSFWVLFKKLGSKKFYEKLLELDPKVKNRINPKDSQRIQRAYEVKLKTKKSLFDWFAKTKSDFLDFDLRKVFIDIPRIDLLPNISKRTELMFKKNCLKEVKKFNLMKLNKSLSANKLIGVQEINQFIKESISLDECKDLINIKTRQYAKRQNTWARGHMKNWNKLYSKNFSILLKKTLKVIS